MFSEKDMENAIANDPERFLRRKGLKLIKQQHRIGNHQFDVLFENKHGEILIVEVQKGTLDRNHMFKIIEYSIRYRNKNPLKKVNVIIVANVIPRERRQFLDEVGVSYLEFSDNEIIRYKHNIKSKNTDEKTEEEILSLSQHSSVSGPNPLRQQLLETVSKKISIFQGRTVDITKNNISAPAGKGRSEWVIVTRNKDCRVELAFRDGNTSKLYFQKMEKYKSQIEKEFGEKLFWDFKEGRKNQYIKTIDKDFEEISGALEVVIYHLVDCIEKFIFVVGKYWDKVQ
jgi:hypothetical protein